MDIVIRELMAEDQHIKIDLDNSFVVDSVAVVSCIEQLFSYTVKEVPTYIKEYPEDTIIKDYSEFIDNPKQIIYLAFLGEKVVGQIILKKSWNHYAYIDYIIVDSQYRRDGIGQKLIEQAKYWARTGGMPGISLETQNINVKACKFYDRCGFKIGGIDNYLYKGLDQQSKEIAIYWYLLFEE
ncbi:GNAT family N-acetyltransferase [Chengkuizengella axinellae]|uniref:GNAT family N-acetyltransferase n=1 Tax=Chengkuizengella axinellae TaxID=3064388 RepID=A0ABT9IVZ7_9BACL|nr:GNAT family N-acetyltransferase [Chengkuizengella sp. 2205SS18-9]MDP5273531.1 GNAT family N-acetyltransferase [Chengkuizengella sp. 2205SS18-9]